MIEMDDVKKFNVNDLEEQIKELQKCLENKSAANNFLKEKYESENKKLKETNEELNRKILFIESDDLRKEGIFLMNKDRAKTLLTFYIETLWEKVGLDFDFDNKAEIVELIDCIFDEIKKEMPSESIKNIENIRDDSKIDDFSDYNIIKGDLMIKITLKKEKDNVFYQCYKIHYDSNFLRIILNKNDENTIILNMKDVKQFSYYINKPIERKRK
jgi:hypothetical protein